ncbi:hypothetical protein EJ05DRAFT_143158 [Pseudovirgaria hyperparasitica]|uniref:Uncharacterized protein n=1 Tax=Pseudovirgaria hyperparasitica TaxID=470096 RepID=A0A6A6VUX7_9PEZI|nr:uncharacterized protein EJ05DRAFT_143158 [Pseudovirgaria hyperparasitica]KAF2754488.1 hypothetical protein EJ05DRAFT_143158 [Pseudovirgaria hyperparasitica]
MPSFAPLPTKDTPQPTVSEEEADAEHSSSSHSDSSSHNPHADAAADGYADKPRRRQTVANMLRRRATTWPDRPQTVEKTARARLVDCAPYAALLLVPVGFLVLAGFIWRLGGRERSEGGDRVVLAMGVASTLWPIGFAAVMGPMLKSVALWAAERGVTLRMLELLSSSDTVVSTLKTCFDLQYISIWPLALIAIWLLSPAGGQAVLRALTLHTPVLTASYPLTYHPSSAIGIPLDTLTWGSASSGFYGAAGGVVRMAFGAVISAPNAAALLVNGTTTAGSFDEAVERLGGVEKVLAAARTDIWGNVRMPLLEMLPGYDAGKPGEWVDVPTDQVPVYESLVGVPVRGVPMGEVGNLTFGIAAAYTRLTCSDWQNTTTWETDYSNRLDGQPYNASEAFGSASDPGSSNIKLTLLSTRLYPLPTISFGTRTDTTLCTITTTHIDALVSCARGTPSGDLSCRAQRARHSPEYPVSNATAQFDPANSGTAAIQFFASIPRILTTYHAGTQTPLESYLANPLNGGIDASVGGVAIKDEYKDLPAGVFEARLAVVVNSVLRLTYGTAIVLGTSGINTTAASEDTTAADYQPTYANTTGTWTTFSPPIYDLHRGWLALYTLSIGVLVLAVLAMVYLRSRIRIPDMLNSMSMLARESPYVSTAPGGGMLDGMQMVEVLGRKRVRIGDVAPERAVGKIAFADEERVERVRRGRLYL